MTHEEICQDVFQIVERRKGCVYRTKYLGRQWFGLTDVPAVRKQQAADKFGVNLIDIDLQPLSSTMTQEVIYTDRLQTIVCCETAAYLATNSSFNREFHAVITDPPFNIGQAYDVADDKKDAAEYREWYKRWFHSASRCLRPGGVFAINVPDDLVQLTLECARDNCLHRIDWCIWHYKFGQCHNHSFISSHTHCLIFASDFEHTLHAWNWQDILQTSDRDSKYNDSRTASSATPGLRVPLDVWSIDNDGPNWGRIVGNNLEKIDGHPNQLPEKYIERLILAYTNPGDLILEPFGGTGTTPVVADALGRRCVTLELSRAYCDDIVARLNKGAVRV